MDKSSKYDNIVWPSFIGKFNRVVGIGEAAKEVLSLIPSLRQKQVACTGSNRFSPIPAICLDPEGVLSERTLREMEPDLIVLSDEDLADQLTYNVRPSVQIWKFNGDTLRSRIEAVLELSTYVGDEDRTHPKMVDLLHRIKVCEDSLELANPHGVLVLSSIEPLKTPGGVVPEILRLNGKVDILANEGDSESIVDVPFSELVFDEVALYPSSFPNFVELIQQLENLTELPVEQRIFGGHTPFLPHLTFADIL